MKHLKILAFLFLSTLVMTSCGKDDDSGSDDDGSGPSVTANGSFTVDGNEYDLQDGIIEDYGEWSTGVYNFDLTLVTTELSVVNGELQPEDNVFSLVYFELITDDASGLANGTYTYSVGESAGTFVSAEVIIDHNYSGGGTGSFYNITEGSVTINKSGSTYTITFDCATADGMEVSGTYEGSLTMM